MGDVVREKGKKRRKKREEKVRRLQSPKVGVGVAFKGEGRTPPLDLILGHPTQR